MRWQHWGRRDMPGATKPVLNHSRHCAQYLGREPVNLVGAQIDGRTAAAAELQGRTSPRIRVAIAAGIRAIARRTVGKSGHRGRWYPEATNSTHCSRSDSRRCERHVAHRFTNVRRCHVPSRGGTIETTDTKSRSCSPEAPSLPDAGSTTASRFSPQEARQE